MLSVVHLHYHTHFQNNNKFVLRPEPGWANKCHHSQIYCQHQTGYHLLIFDGRDWAGLQHSSLRPLLTVPNVTAHPSTASVPITVLLYNGPLLCGFNVPINGLNQMYWLNLFRRSSGMSLLPAFVLTMQTTAYPSTSRHASVSREPLVPWGMLSIQKASLAQSLA